jgi:hypothetical protein
MRLKILVQIFLVGLLFFGLLIFARVQQERNARSDRANAEVAMTQSSRREKPSDHKTPRPSLPLSTDEPQINEQTPAAQHELVQKRVDELMDLAMADDAASLDMILSELTNQDPEIRKAALEATKQFGSRDAIPKLMEVVSQVDDPKEKVEIVDAIEFLKLPSVTEVIAQGGNKKPQRLPSANFTRPSPAGARR